MTSVDARLSAALIDRYSIVREIGQGGMATVYLAEDVRHERRVALKVLRPELAAVVGVERFLKEIKTTANLQHPHILPLHDSGEVNGGVFYVMPYVEGESLRDRLTRDKQLPVDDAVRIAREVLSALDYAHRHGVVHRDIKPENILLHDGQALVADFGIALAVSTAGAGTRMTETGMSLGTPHYMSPEQAMGEREVSARSDVYAMGCVLYEMLLGEPPFTGPTAQAIIARVITEEPRRMLAQRKTIPAHVEAAALKSLAKLPADRFATAAEFAEALGKPGLTTASSLDTATAPVVAQRDATWRKPIVIGSLAIAALAIATAGWALTRSKPESTRRLVRFEVAHPADDHLSDEARPIALSPDGQTIAYTVLNGRSTQIHMRRLSDLEARPVTGTEGALSLMFSPDGQWIAFFRGPTLYKVPLSGGQPTKVADVSLPQADGSWSPDGWIVISTAANGVLYRIRADGGPLEQFTSPDTSRGELGHFRPQVLPDGEHVLFDVSLSDGTHPAVLSMKTGKWSDLGLGVTTLTTYSAGHLLYLQGNRIMAVPFELPDRVNGTPAVVDSLPSSGGSAGRAFWYLSASPDGMLLYMSGHGTVGDRSMVWVDRTGAVTESAVTSRDMVQPRLSPGGSKVVVQSSTGAGAAIGFLDVLETTGGGRSRIGHGATPVWSPDGRQIAYSTATGGMMGISSADGTGPTVNVEFQGELAFPYDWSADGRTIGAYTLNSRTKRDLHLLQRDGNGWKKTPFLVTPANERSPAISPDSRWVAYASDESGEDEIYVRPNPGEGKFTISRDGGREPIWSGDGKELFFRRGDEILAAPVRTAPSFSSGEPKVMFSLRAYKLSGPTGQRDWDVSRDGRRFVFLRYNQSTSAFTLTVVLDWPALLAGSDRR